MRPNLGYKRRVIAALLLMASSVAMLAGEVEASGAVGGSETHRVQQDLGFDEIHSMQASESNNRLVLVGDNKVRLVDLASLATVATVEGVYGAQESQVLGSSVFVSVRDFGAIFEISMLDGTLLNRWDTGLLGLGSFTVNDKNIFFIFDDPGEHDEIGMIDRDSAVVTVLDSERMSRGTIRTGTRHPNEFFYSTGVDRGQIYHVRVEDGDAVLVGDTGLEGRWHSIRDFAVSGDEQRIWTANSAGSRVREIDASTLEDTSLEYQDVSDPYKISFDREREDRFVVASHNYLGVSSISLFERGNVDRLTRSIEIGFASAVAASGSGYFAVMDDRAGALSLHAWTDSHVEVVATVTISAHSLGTVGEEGLTVNVHCSGSWRESFALEFGENAEVTFPLEGRECYAIAHRAHTTLGVIFYASARTGDDWQPTKGNSRLFNPKTTGQVTFFVYGHSAPGSTVEFAEQSYWDVTGMEASRDEVSRVYSDIRRGRITRAQYVVALMDGEADGATIRGPISRLYQSYFLRDPDPAGIRYWIDSYQDGRSLASVSNFFESSPEAVGLYGELNDEEFIDQVYRNVMSRPADAEGYDYWLERMDQGLSRGELMMFFSDSSEYRTIIDARLFITYGFRTLIRRDPTEAEISDLEPVFRADGRVGVVFQIYNTDAYRDRFWDFKGVALAGTVPEGIPDV